MAATTSPNPPSARFTLELEFVLCLSNPYYLSHLALTYPHLLNPPAPPPSLKTSPPQQQQKHVPESDAAKFASYLSYLYTYWRRPEYARFLTHPSTTLRNLELLQHERFRRDIIRPDVIERLLTTGGADLVTDDKVVTEGGDEKKKQDEKGEEGEDDTQGRGRGGAEIQMAPAAAESGQVR